MEKPRQNQHLERRDRPKRHDALVVIVRLLARQAAKEVFGNSDADPEIERDGSSHE